MTKYKRKSVFRPKRLDFSIDAKLTSKGKRYRIQVANLAKSDLTVMKEPTKWQRFKINQHAILLHAKASYSSSFTVKGEDVTLLKFSDGRMIRLYSDDFTLRDMAKLVRFMCAIYQDKSGGRNKKN